MCIRDRIYPELKGKLNGHAVRAPVLNASLTDCVFELKRETTVEEVNQLFAQAAEATVGHLRDRNGRHEIDLVVARSDQRIVAIEVKLSATIEDSDVRHLRWLREQLGPALLDAIVLSTGTEAYRRSDGIGVVPLALLGP